jgi:outer membrane protein
VLPENLIDAQEMLFTDSPSLRQVDALEQIADAAIKVALSKKKPRIELFGTASTREGNWDNHFRDDSAVIGARGTIPLYTGGRLDAGIREAKLSRAQIRMTRLTTRNQLISALARAWSSHEASVTSLDAAQEEVNASQVALDGAEIELEVGLRTTLELLDQEQDLLEAQLRLIQAEKNVYVSASDILSLLGQMGL